jgi:hypothetical protein
MRMVQLIARKPAQVSVSEEDETPADPVAWTVLDKMFGPPFSERKKKLVADSPTGSSESRPYRGIDEN